MSAEIKSKGERMEVVLSKNLKQRFKSRCKKLNVSLAQRIRDLIQSDLKTK